MYLGIYKKKQRPLSQRSLLFFSSEARKGLAVASATTIAGFGLGLHRGVVGLLERHVLHQRLGDDELLHDLALLVDGLTDHSLLYAVSVVPMAFSYIAAVCLLFMRRPDWLAPLGLPGRMALTCYIMQSVIGVLLFYGLGLGLGTTFGLITIELTAVIVFLFQIVVCRLWLRYFRFGPLEWVWRMLTYGRYFPILHSESS